MVKKEKKIGDRISFKVGGRRAIRKGVQTMIGGKRVTGTVVGIRKHYYLVKRGSHIYKVDRHSIFYALGRLAGRIGAKAVGTAQEIYRAYREERARYKAIRPRYRYHRPRVRRVRVRIRR